MYLETLITLGQAKINYIKTKSPTLSSQFMETSQSRQGLKISCIEEIAYRKGFIDKDQLCKLAEPIRKSGYGEYLLSIR